MYRANLKMIKGFLNWMAERHSIYLRRLKGEPKPWTKDKILRDFKFTNVFRELDKVTIWIRENWKEPYADHPNLWFAMCVARQINHPETLKELEPLVFAKTWNAKKAAKIMDARKARGEKVYTGAYMIRAESDPNKEWYSWSKNLYMTEIVLGRVWKARKDFYKLMETEPSLQEVNDWLCTFHGWGGFMSYEVTTDLRHTGYLDRAKDIKTWANPGPGAKRGTHRILFNTRRGDLPTGFKRPDYQQAMQEFLAAAKDKLEGTAIFKGHRFEMRDIEHSLCEFDKYMRVKNGEGRPRSRYNGGKE